MKRQTLLFILAIGLVFTTQNVYSQILVSDIPTATADPASMLDVQSTTKGLLFPRMTEAQRNVISNPPTSLVIFQTDNTPGLYYNVGSAAIPDWQVITDGLTPAGYWTQSGSDIYYNTGNVGIGRTTPGAELDVNGRIWAYDSIAVTGRPGKIFINGETNYSPMIRWGYEGNEMFYHDIWDITGYQYWSMSSTGSKDFWMINPEGRLWHDYYGTNSAHVIKTDAPSRALSIENTNGAADARGIQVSMSNTSSVVGVIGVGGWAYGSGSAVYGQNVSVTVPDNNGNYGYLGTPNQGAYGQHYPSENRGSLGSSTYGAYGRSGETDYHWGVLGLDGTTTDWGVYGAEGTLTSPNWGGIGTEDYGVYGEFNSEDFFGVLGKDDCGVFGYLGGTGQNLDDGDFAIIGRGVEDSGESGSDFDRNSTIGGVKGWNAVGVEYSFGVAGYTTTDNERTGGTLGYINSNRWGSLGYRSSGSTNYGGYFTSVENSGNSNGKSQSDPLIDIGIGAFGDLFGAKINGNVYGLYSKGEDYSVYADGDVYRTGADVHLQTDNSGQNSVMYTLVSPEMTIQTYGVGQLQGGKSNISFDDAFASVVSSNEPVIVTITPIGETEGVHLQQVDGKGFTVVENRSGKSNVQFSWIAIGKRSGFENKSLPEDVIANDYNEKIERGLTNDADRDAEGEGLYYQNGKLYTGKIAQPRTATEVEPISKPEHFIVDEEKESLNTLPMLKIEEETKAEEDEK